MQGKFAHMVSLRGLRVTSVPIAEAIAHQRLVPEDGEIVKAARAVGITLEMNSGAHNCVFKNRQGAKTQRFFRIS